MDEQRVDSTEQCANKRCDNHDEQHRINTRSHGNDHRRIARHNRHRRKRHINATRNHDYIHASREYRHTGAVASQIGKRTERKEIGVDYGDDNRICHDDDH